VNWPHGSSSHLQQVDLHPTECERKRKKDDDTANLCGSKRLMIIE